MKILILGVTGFIGKNLHARLVKDGYIVVGCSRSTGIDILNYNQFKEFIDKEKPDVIYNVACHVGSMRYVSSNAADVISDNIQMSINLYRAVNELNPAIKIIQPLANCGYPGDSSVQCEDDWLSGDVHESVFSFGNSKRCMYYISKCYNDQYGVNTVNLLFPNTYGPGDSVDPNHTHAINGMIIRMLETKRSGDKEFVVWGSGNPIREWAYIDDFIEALIEGMKLDNIIHPINVGQQKGYSISESAKLIKEEIGFSGKIVFNTNYKDGDPVKIMSRKRFDTFFTSFEWFDHRQGIANTIKYYEGAL